MNRLGRIIGLLVVGGLLAWYCIWFAVAGNGCESDGGTWVASWPTYTCIGADE